MRTVVLVSIFAAAPVAVAATPRFDCAKAASAVEEVVCGDEPLAALDVELARLWTKGMTQAVVDLPGGKSFTACKVSGPR
jgi:uncharacterized protein